MRIMHHILFVLQDQEDQQDQTVSLSIHIYHFNLIKTNLNLYIHHRYQSLTTLQLSKVRAIAVFPVFRLLTDFICLLIYEFCLSLWKIARCSVILLLPLFVFLYFAPMHLLFYISFVLGTVVPLFVFLFFNLVSRSSFI